MVASAMARRSTAALVLLLGGCGEVPTFSPDAASISVRSLTSGDPVESDGYEVMLDGRSSRPLGPNASLSISPVEPGDHTLELSGIDPQCTVNGANPRTVHTQPGLTAESIFIVGCNVPGTGRILAQTYTYGEGPVHYRLDLDPGRSVQIGANDRITFFAIPAGPVVLTLSEVPDNCIVFGTNPRTVRLPEGLEIGSQFKIYCVN